MNYIYTLVIILTINLSLNAQSFVENESQINNSMLSVGSSTFHGRWHQVEVILTLDDSIGFAPNVKETIKKSIETQRKVKEQIQNGELAIITQFNHDGTFSHEIVYSNPKIRFPAWRETDTWSWDDNINTMSRKAENMEFTSLELATVKKNNNDELVLQVKFMNGEAKGIVETVYLRRFLETKAAKN